MVFARQWYKRKTTKLQIYWSSNVRKRYKRNAFFVDLHRAKKYLQISRQKLPANFENLITRYDSLISTSSLQYSYIPPNLFEQKPFILIEIPFWNRNENKSKNS